MPSTLSIPPTVLEKTALALMILVMILMIVAIFNMGLICITMIREASEGDGIGRGTREERGRILVIDLPSEDDYEGNDYGGGEEYEEDVFGRGNGYYGDDEDDHEEY